MIVFNPRTQQSRLLLCDGRTESLPAIQTAHTMADKIAAGCAMALLVAAFVAVSVIVGMGA